MLLLVVLAGLVVWAALPRLADVVGVVVLIGLMTAELAAIGTVVWAILVWGR